MGEQFRAAEVLTAGTPMAYFGGTLATGLVQVADLVSDPDVLDRGGWWAVAATFEGRRDAYRFEHVRPASLPRTGNGRWVGPGACSWRSSISRRDYLAKVSVIRDRIAAGDVYQVNLCRMLSAPLPEQADPLALAARITAGNPAPYQGMLHTGTEWLVTASPELYLSRTGSTVVSAPVKGTARTAEPFADKDYPENIMITDLVRNDLGRVARAGSVKVNALLDRQEHPGLAHLVSNLEAELRPGVGWGELLAATFPPGSVSGAPKHTALQLISDLEPVPRGLYCGAIGHVDADRKSGVLAVGIRTMFSSTTPEGTRVLNFGTGAGITYASDPTAEWEETELKAARLVALASS
jgi:para-aminobenzoate synthetase component 1